MKELHILDHCKSVEDIVSKCKNIFTNVDVLVHCSSVVDLVGAFLDICCIVTSIMFSWIELRKLCGSVISVFGEAVSEIQSM